eukprot:UN19222
MSSITMFYVRSHQQGPVEIGRADYKVAKGDDYDLDISDSDFLKPRFWYVPLSRFDPHEGEKVEVKYDDFITEFMVNIFY